jgi:leader peptidase (prepilin peptidase)/N-methyltransferase
MTLFIIFIFGLIIGSFLNAVIFRLGEEESFVAGRSKCPHCHHELGVLDLIPVFSFIFLRGHCRYCHKPISWQYPIVELITGIVFVLLAYNLQPRTYNLEFGVQLVLASFLIVIAVFDLKHYLILDKVVFPALAIVTIYNIYAGQFVWGIMGALVVAGFFAAQYFLSQGRWIGFGDVKLGLLLGSMVGFKLGVVMLMLAYFSGALVGVTLILMKKKKLGSELPFGVFLSISAIIMMLYGDKITNWYLGLIGF